jgi:hypothetical protein
MCIEPTYARDVADRDTRPRVLAERQIAVGVKWQARIGDRGRLEVVAIVAPSRHETSVPLLSDGELRELLAEGDRQDAEHWICAGCGAMNEPGRRWCRVCSDHVLEGAAR